MATCLEMCNTVAREAGVSMSDPIASILNQTGINNVVVKAVLAADYTIQGKCHSWKFLWKQWTQVLDIGANTGLFNEYAPPTDIGEFIYSDYAVLIGGVAVTLAEYERVRIQAASTTTGVPSAVIILPSGRLRVTPIPTSALTLTAEYYRSPLRMTGNSDISLIPAKHHRAIETLAIADVHAYNEDWEAHKSYMVKYDGEMVKLEAAQILGQLERTSGSAGSNTVIVV